MPTPLRLLIVEDQAADAELMVHQLHRDGFEPDWLRVETESDYLAHLDPGVDVILADYSLPQFDAARALSLLQQRGLDIPLIVVTGSIGEELAVECLKEGAADYLLKDRLARLGRAVRRALEERRLRDEKRQGEAARARLSAILEATTDLVGIADREGRAIFLNKGGRTMLGIGPEEDIAGVMFGDYLPDWERALALHEAIPTAVREGTWRGESVLLSRDGREIPVLQVVLAHKLPDGTVDFLSTIGHDITERKRAEEALRESNRRLQEALAELQRVQQQMIQQERLHALGQMASGVVHEFKNLLTPILGFSELLLTHPDDLGDKDKVTSYLEMISAGAKDAASVVDRLGVFYRHGEEGAAEAPVDLSELVKQAISLTRPRWKDQALMSGVTINIETDLQPVPLIAGNQAELREVLTNLVFNAVDAVQQRAELVGQKEGYARAEKPWQATITVRTRAESVGETVPLVSSLPEAATHVVLEVGDTGTGMTDEVRRSCLEPFFSTKGTGGTGLGLAVVYGILRRHGGTIDVESELGEGTRFIVRLPVWTAREAEGAKQAPAAAPPGRLRVLVVDDDPLACEVAAAYLVADGHSVETAANGSEGLSKFRAGDFDLVVTDSAMPEVAGGELVAAIKQISPPTPVILLTALGDTVGAAGADLALAKPVTLAAFRQALATVMAR